MAYVPWLTGDVILASRLNKMTRVAGAWNGSAGNELYLPASAFIPFPPWTSAPHATYVITAGGNTGEWVTLPWPNEAYQGAMCHIAVPTQCNGLMKFRVWYLDLSGVPSSTYYLALRFGPCGLGEPTGINQIGYDQQVPGYLSTQGIYAGPWTGYFATGLEAGDLLMVFVFRAGTHGGDTATNDFPFVGLSLSFQTNAVNDA